jgi:hypothetical protein
MKEREYKQNRDEVYDLYGITKKDRHKYSMHHIIFRSDIKNGDWEGFRVDKKANLYPLLKEEHKELHKRVEEINNERASL